jgi:hypothetical protein
MRVHCVWHKNFCGGCSDCKIVLEEHYDTLCVIVETAKVTVDHLIKNAPFMDIVEGTRGLQDLKRTLDPAVPLACVAYGSKE